MPLFFSFCKKSTLLFTLSLKKKYTTSNLYLTYRFLIMYTSKRRSSSLAVSTVQLVARRNLSMASGIAPASSQLKASHTKLKS
jgi:hypothetical protein